MSDSVDLVLPILRRIQEDLAVVRKQTEAIPEMGRDIQELVSRMGQARESLEARVRRIEEHLHLA